MRRALIAVALCLCSISPSVAQSVPLAPFSAPLMTPCVNQGVTVIRNTPTVVVDVRDASRNLGISASNPVGGQLDSTAIDFYDLNPDGTVNYRAWFFSASGIQNGQALPVGYPGIIYHFAPYGFACVTSAQLIGNGVLIEGQ
ncbi:MAG: hypothetical protein NVS2B17_29180 [Candidatus Velthaea sp.]